MRLAYSSKPCQDLKAHHERITEKCPTATQLCALRAIAKKNLNLPVTPSGARFENARTSAPKQPDSDEGWISQSLGPCQGTVHTGRGGAPKCCLQKTEHVVAQWECSHSIARNIKGCARKFACKCACASCVNGALKSGDLGPL